jgi:D-amino-acid dehydrogenase
VNTTVIIGAGLAGLSTACELVRRGKEVTVLEAGEDVAMDASYANGSMLTPSMADPWNAPGVHRHLVASIIDPRAALKLRLSALPSLLLWGLEFLRNSAPARHLAVTRAAYRLANYSVRATRELRERLSLDYGASTCGTMKLFHDGRALENALSLARTLEPHGLRFALLDREGAILAEPEVAAIGPKITGALLFPDDESGDAHQFCVALAALIESGSGQIRRGLAAMRIETRRRAAVGVDTPAGPVEATQVVVAAGVHSRSLTRRHGIDLAIRPAKGYSVTLDVSALARRPVIPVVDDTLHVAIVPMGDRLRIAGTAEFAGMNRTIRPERIESLHEALSATYPEVARRVDMRSAVPWAGLRPMSADGLPYLGETPVRGLYVNAGHGHLGWTMAVGSARLLADIVMGEPPAMDPRPHRVGR